MTPKENAQKLVDKYRTYIRMADKYGYNLADDEIYLAKQCAIISVDEMIDELDDNYDTTHSLDRKLYWYEVRVQINNI